ncbi:MAG: Uncharacterised protein [Pseudidiomarina mangrovi]|nr:MAG: Uncharacterised protein [Pseudidiomarina mangrovi]
MTKGDFIEVELENFVFGEFAFHPQGNKGFFDFARPSLLKTQIKITRCLLGNGGTTALNIPG